MGRRKREPMSEGKRNIKAVLPQTHYSRVDSAEDKLQALELSRPEKAELAEIKDDLKELNDKFATKEEVREVKEAMNKITKDIDFIKEKTVRNDEFIRVIARLEGKMDELLRR